MSSLIALDVGEKRIGVARASTIARLAEPLMTIEHTDAVMDTIEQLIAEHAVSTVVVGLPRNLSGEDTAQTDTVRTFAAQLRGVEVVFQDEALTSRKAEAELQNRGKPYQKGDIDALAATYILDDYLNAQGEVNA